MEQTSLLKKAGDIYLEPHTHEQHSLSFPDKRLHAVACRWRQTRERRRIPEKSEQLGKESHTDYSLVCMHGVIRYSIISSSAHTLYVFLYLMRPISPKPRSVVQ